MCLQWYTQATRHGEPSCNTSYGSSWFTLLTASKALSSLITDATLLCIYIYTYYKLNRVGLIRPTGWPVIVGIVQGCLVAAGYCPLHPDQCPSLTTDHRWCPRRLAHKHHKLYSQPMSQVLFTDDFMVSLYNCNGHAWVFCLVDCSMQETNGICSTIIRMVEAEPELISECRMRPVLMVPVLEHVSQNASVATMKMSQPVASVSMYWVISSLF